MMHKEPAHGLATDSDFFDWDFDPDRRFFVAPEILANGYRIANPRDRLDPRYVSELPRSAS